MIMLPCRALSGWLIAPIVIGLAGCAFLPGSRPPAMSSAKTQGPDPLAKTQASDPKDKELKQPKGSLANLLKNKAPEAKPKESEGPVLKPPPDEQDAGEPKPAPALLIPGPAPPVQSKNDAVPSFPLAAPTFPPPAYAAHAPVLATAFTMQAPPSKEAAPPSPMRELQRKAAERYALIDSYMVRMKRREVVNGQQRPEEIMLLKFRKDPWSVYVKWLGPEAQGREVVYVKGKYKNELVTLTAAGDVFLLPAGRRFSLPPDSPLIKSKSRYPITEAGMGGIIERFGKLVDAVERGDTRQGTIKYLGKIVRPEFSDKVAAVMQTMGPGADPLLPKGGQRLWFFDSHTHLPALVITHDDSGREVEYYCYDRFLYPVRLDDDDFNPDKLWPNTK